MKVLVTGATGSSVACFAVVYTKPAITSGPSPVTQRQSTAECPGWSNAFPGHRFHRSPTRGARRGRGSGALGRREHRRSVD